MATVSLIMALMALGVVVSALVWCQKLAESGTHLRASICDGDTQERLATLANEFPPLHARVDHLRQCWHADTGQLESTVRQAESQTAGLEQGAGTLAAVSRDLAGLRDFRAEVRSALQQFENRTVELERRYGSLSAMAKDLDGLRDFHREVESILQQVESRIVALEHRYGSLGTVSQDLDNLRAFRSRVERVHTGIQKAFNGSRAGTSPAPLQDEKRS